AAQDMAAKITAALTGAGIWGVEFFLADDGVIFSELSPRPHDTGMVTLAHSTALSEFELHFRALMGLPIPEIKLERPAASAVVLSPVESDRPLDYHLDEAFSQENTIVRVFGKPDAHVGRRMAVVLCYGDKGTSVDELRSKAKRLASTIL
ncbi:MAG TPA: phosphoribosylglycinamide formyltransferase 2, partial [Rikenellaceae bacterium]|nr:phosphoribosylglycinamide formyltransferase 2 [Rikenellaceae bacterium]